MSPSLVVRYYLCMETLIAILILVVVLSIIYAIISFLPLPANVKGIVIATILLIGLILFLRGDLMAIT